jgi:hypothetical protein
VSRLSSGKGQPMARENGFFDDLARGLADGSITRGKALRLMGAALVGGALASVGIGEAAAAPLLAVSARGSGVGRTVRAVAGSAWTVCAAAANQYVIRPAQRDVSAWKQGRESQSAIQYVLRAAVPGRLALPTRMVRRFALADRAIVRMTAQCAQA